MWEGLSCDFRGNVSNVAAMTSVQNIAVWDCPNSCYYDTQINCTHFSFVYSTSTIGTCFKIQARNPQTIQPVYALNHQCGFVANRLSKYILTYHQSPFIDSDFLFLNKKLVKIRSTRRTQCKCSHLLVTPECLPCLDGIWKTNIAVQKISISLLGGTPVVIFQETLLRVQV